MYIKTITEIWNRRSLIMAFALTDLKVRYKNSILGFLWSFLEPLLMLGVLYIAFTTIFKTQIPNYPIYLLLGLIMWGVYSRGTGSGLTSLLSKAGLISKTSFPREIPVISINITSFLMMIFEFVAFGVFVVIFQFVPPQTIFLLPLILAILFIYTLGISFALSVLGVHFRDLSSIWTVLLQVTFFMTPIIFSLDIFPKEYLAIISLNPLVTIFTMAHDVVLYGNIPSMETWIKSIVISAGALTMGYVIFWKLNKKIIEVL